MFIKVNEHDGLPENICYDCVEQVHRAFAFKKLCQESDDRLRRRYEGGEDIKPSVNAWWTATEKTEETAYSCNSNRTTTVDNNRFCKYLDEPIFNDDDIIKSCEGDKNCATLEESSDSSIGNKEEIKKVSNFLNRVVTRGTSINTVMPSERE